MQIGCDTLYLEMFMPTCWRSTRSWRPGGRAVWKRICSLVTSSVTGRIHLNADRMRYLLFGDVHANVLALDAVLEAGRARGVETYLFVGDLVGYGPNPLECIERLAPLAECGSLAWVLGNHEMVLRGDFEPTGYSAEAIQTLEWARKQVEGNLAAKAFITSGHLTSVANDVIWLTHDSLADPSSGGYHRWPQNAKKELASLRSEQGRVCFYGHTHKMRAEVSEGEKPVV